MTSQSPRIYTYKITFEEVPYYYYGVHKEKRFNEEYWGSPERNKWCWKLYTPKKQILELFDFTDEGWIEANLVEDRLIKPVYNSDKWCLNESCGGITSIKIRRETGKIMHQNKIGLHKLTKEERIEIGRRGGTTTKKLKKGIHGLTKEERIEHASKTGKLTYELKVGVHGLTKCELSEAGKKGYSRGLSKRTKEEMIENVKKTNSQKWMCLETGFITTSGPLTNYQRKRGIDTSKRKRIA
jgi:hypothetical protein